MNDDVDIQFFYLKYRPYTTVANGAEMMKLIDNSFISPLDIVYNEEEDCYEWVYDYELMQYTGIKDKNNKFD